jgi:hypothetical protein
LLAPEFPLKPALPFMHQAQGHSRVTAAALTSGGQFFGQSTQSLL